jgi:hypothetical protein
MEKAMRGMVEGMDFVDAANWGLRCASKRGATGKVAAIPVLESELSA